MEEISSQNSDLGLEDLDKLEAKGQAENTKRATSWEIKKFEKWCNKRKLKVEFDCATPVELNELLRKLYAEVKSEKRPTANTKYSNWYSSCDPPTMNDMPVIRDPCMRKGFWDRQGANIASR